MRIYGLTGGIACGKSTVAALLRQRGYAVIDADQIARDVAVPGSEGLAALTARFGPGILGPDGHLDRQRLAQLVFASETDRQDLNAIMHPRIAAASAAKFAALAATGHTIAFYEAALLVETGSYKHFDGLIVVACDPAAQLARAIARDHTPAAEAEARLRAQAPLETKLAVATHVIWNNGSPKDLEREVDALLAKLAARPEAEA